MTRKKRWLYILLIVPITFLLFFYWQNSCLQVSKYILDYNDIPEGLKGYKIVQISDMHGKTFGRNNVSLAKTIESLKPNVVFCTGDMMSSTINDGKAFLDFLEQFNNFCPVYMCLGNHEQIARWFNNNGDFEVDYYKFIEEAEKRGATLLDNTSVLLKNNNDTITVSGLTLELYHYSRRDIEPQDESMYLKTSYINDVLGNSSNGFNILLAHNPSYFKEYTEWGADLILSGHVHGGVIRVPFMGGLLSPEHVFFPEYDAGLFEKGSSKMIVNRGLGNSVFNFRLFNRPEITYIELR